MNTSWLSVLPAYIIFSGRTTPSLERNSQRKGEYETGKGSSSLMHTHLAEVDPIPSLPDLYFKNPSHWDLLDDSGHYLNSDLHLMGGAQIGHTFLLQLTPSWCLCLSTKPSSSWWKRVSCVPEGVRSLTTVNSSLKQLVKKSDSFALPQPTDVAHHICQRNNTLPKKGTKWCSQRENISMSFTITISSWSSSKTASLSISGGERRLFMEEENERSSLNSILDYRITNGRHWHRIG